MKELVKTFREIINTSYDKEEEVFMQKKGFKGLKLDKKFFHELKAKNHDLITCFIDGGNAEIIKTNNVSIQAIRVAGIGYKNNKKVFLEKKDFFAIISFSEGNYNIKTMPEEFLFEINSNDESMKDGRNTADISRIGGFVRRLAELKTATELIEEVHIMVLDGSLEEKFEQEKNYLSRLYEMVEHHRVVLAGLCKTNSLVIKNGLSVSSRLKKMMKGQWYYHPLIEANNQDLKAEIFMVKLHKKSKHVFRVDLHHGDALTLFSELANNSSDPIFLGYPYGLVEVDRIARISNHERNLMRTRLMIELGKDWKSVEDMESDADAHSILDNIS